MSENICIECINIFKDITEEEKRKIVSHFRKKKYNKGEMIFTPYEDFENLCMIYKGEVLIYQISAEGKKIIIDILKDGDMLSNFSLYFDSSVKVTDFAEAITNSEIYIISKEEFLDIISEYPNVALGVIKELGRKLNEADSKIRDLALNNATIRAINELLRLSKKLGIETQKGIKIDTHLTHEEFAHMIGTSRETATKVLRKLLGLSFIELSKDKRIIINSEKIKEPI